MAIQRNDIGGRTMNHRLFNGNILLCFVALLGTAGCNSSEPPEFRLNMVQMVSEETPTSPEYQQEIADVLGAVWHSGSAFCDA